MMRGITVFAVWAMCGVVYAQSPNPLQVVELVDNEDMNEISGGWKQDIDGGVKWQDTWYNRTVRYWMNFGGDFVHPAVLEFQVTASVGGRYGLYANMATPPGRNPPGRIYLDVGDGESLVSYSESGAFVHVTDQYGVQHTLSKVGDGLFSELAGGQTLTVRVRADPDRTYTPVDVFALVLEEAFEGGGPGGPGEPDPEDPEDPEPELDYDCNCNGIEDAEELQDPANDTNGNGILDACETLDENEEIVKAPGGCGKYDEEDEDEDEDCDDCVCELLEDILEQLQDGTTDGHLERIRTEQEYTNEGLEKIGENAIRVYEMPTGSDFVPDSLKFNIPMPNLEERPWFSDPGTTRDYAYFSEGGIFSIGEFEMNTGLYSNGPFPAVVSSLEGTAPVVRAFLLVVGVVVPGVRFVQQQLWTI